jgi:predicted MFS family arabinose efflux permease
VYNVNEISLRQAITREHARGRVNAAIRFGELSALLGGSLIAGVIGEALGLRLTLAAGAAFALAGAALLASPIRNLRTAPPAPGEQSEAAALS